MSCSSSVMVVYKSSGLCKKPCPRSQDALSWNPVSRLSLISKCKNEMYFLGRSDNKTKSVPEAPAPGSGPPPSNFVSWILGLFTNKWGPLWLLKNRIDNAVQKVEDIVEAVEKVAEKVDEIAEDIADDLPQGKMKDLLKSIEHLAEKTAKTADCLDNVIDKVQEAEDQMEGIIAESLAENPKIDLGE